MLLRRRARYLALPTANDMLVIPAPYDWLVRHDAGQHCAGCGARPRRLPGAVGDAGLPSPGMHAAQPTALFHFVVLGFKPAGCARKLYWPH
jgi:hypothetical protein